MVEPAGATIMVIGNDSNFCYLMRRYVRQSAHQIIFAYQGEDAVSIAQREAPSAIILEVDLPESAGWSVLKELKANHATSSIPVLLCSWQADETRGLVHGADIHLRKPVLYEDFMTALGRLGIQTQPQARLKPDLME